MILGKEPMLRRDPVIVTQSEIQSYKTCRRQWMLGSYLGLRPKEETVYGPLTLGTRLHKALEVYYTDGVDMLEYYHQLVADEKEAHALSGIMYDENAFDSEAELGRLMLEGYVEWLEETGADAEYEVIGAEDKLTYPLQVDGVDVELRGKIDVRVRNIRTGARLVMDHKSSVNPARLIQALDKNEQLRFYMMLERLQSGREKDDWVQGAVFNILRKVKRGMQSKPPYYFRAEQHHNSETLRSYWQQVYGVMQDLLQTIKRLDDGVDHSTAAYPRAGDHCAWCPFRQPCGMMDDGSRVDAMIDALYVSDDPLKRYNEEPAALIDNSSN